MRTHTFNASKKTAGASKPSPAAGLVPDGHAQVFKRLGRALPRLFTIDTDIAFARDDANRFLPWIIGLMTGLAGLMLCLGISLNEWAIARTGSYSQGFAVHVPWQAEGMSAQVSEVIAALRNMPPIHYAEATPAERVRERLAPWLGDGEMTQALPIPAVIEVRFASDGAAKPQAFDFAALEGKLKMIAPGARVDAREFWAEKFAAFSWALQSLVLVLAALLIAGVALTAVFMARAALKLHARSVQLLHSMGAEDAYVARQFQKNAGILALRGAIPGTMLAAGLYAGLGAYVRSLEAPAMPSLTFSASHALLAVTLPLACALIALAAARLSVLRQLRAVL